MSSYGLTTSGLGALGQSIKIDFIANNLANGSTPGYRRDHVSFRERLDREVQAGRGIGHYNAMAARHGGAPLIDRVQFDHEAGGFEESRSALDFALKSRGFFTVREMSTGKAYYTRAGRFAVNSAGLLTTGDGRYQVLDEDGAGMAFDPAGAGEIALGPGGALHRGETRVGRLGIVDFADYGLLVKHGENLFENAGSPAFVPADIRAEQAVIESSSVNPVVEMVEMIKALRALESNLQMIRLHDAALERTVNDFGRLPR